MSDAAHTPTVDRLVLDALLAGELDQHQLVADLVLQLDIERSMRSVLLAQLHEARLQRQRAAARRPVERAV